MVSHLLLISAKVKCETRRPRPNPLGASHGLHAQWIPIGPLCTMRIVHGFLSVLERGNGSTVNTPQGVIHPHGSIVRHTIKAVQQFQPSATFAHHNFLPVGYRKFHEVTVPLQTYFEKDRPVPQLTAVIASPRHHFSPACESHDTHSSPRRRGCGISMAVLSDGSTVSSEQTREGLRNEEEV